MDLKKRLNNYGLWVAILSLVPVVAQAFGVKVLPENFKEISAAVLGILVLLGVISDPTTSNKGFADDKQEADVTADVPKEN
jgi:uncharacterized membrane protein